MNSTGINSKLQPTVGVSFGLQNQNQQYYGGQPQNYLGTGTGGNPYPGSNGGLSLGALDINPLISFQATTNDAGEIVNKPLINLHVTPNGCGVFGCEDELDPSQFFGTRRNQNQRRPDTRPVHYETLTPSPEWNPVYYPETNYNQKQSYNVPNYPQQQQQHQHHQKTQYHQQQSRPQSNPPRFPQSQHTTPEYQQPQYSQPKYQQPQYPQPQQNRPSSNNRVRFGSQDQKEIVIRHEHVHYHHDSSQSQNNKRYNDNGINFAYNDGPYFRTLNDTVTDYVPEENNQVKRNTALPQSAGEEEKKSSSAFKFPSKSARTLSKRSADHQTPPAVDIQPVGKSFKQPPELNHLNHNFSQIVSIIPTFHQIVIDTNRFLLINSRDNISILVPMDSSHQLVEDQLVDMFVAKLVL